MGALKEQNVMQFIKGGGCESFLSQNPIRLMIFIACGSPLVNVTLISSLGSKSDKTRKYFWVYSGQRHLGVKCECCSWWPQGHTCTLGFLHWFCSFWPWFCSILSRNNYSKPLLSFDLPEKGASSQNYSPSPFQHAWMKTEDLQPPSVQSGLWWIPNIAMHHSYSSSHLNKGTPGITLPQVSSASLVPIRPLKRHKQYVWCRGTKRTTEMNQNQGKIRY